MRRWLTVMNATITHPPKCHTTVSAITMRINVRCSPSCSLSSVKGSEKKTQKFKIHFEVIERTLPFLIGFPSLKAMGASLNFGTMTLGLKLAGGYCEIPLQYDEHHVYLPFNPAERSYYSGMRKSVYALMPSPAIQSAVQDNTNLAAQPI